MVSFDIYDAIIHTIGIMSASLKSRYISIEVENVKNISITGYPNEFKHALFNIINNAKDILEEKKTISPKISITFTTDKNSVSIHIADNGGGINEELLPDAIFEPYVTTKGERGTGIGLQICKMIIEQNMNGKISAKNIKDGAEFVIELPIDKPI